MKTCEEYRDMINEYVDMELSRMERMEVEAHADECTECREYLSDMQELFGAGEYVAMPRSVASDVMKRIHEELDDEGDAFADPKKKLRISEQLEKKRNIRTWGAIAAVLVLAVTSWAIGKYGNFFPLSAASESNMESVTGAEAANSEGDLLSESGVSGKATINGFSSSIADSVRHSDAVIIQFGANRVGATEDAVIQLFADYLEAQPSAEYVSVGASGSLGTITLEPASNYAITITSSHTLLFDDGESVTELQTDRNELLDVLAKLGI